MNNSRQIIVVKRICELYSKVGEEIFGNDEAHDCFCCGEKKNFQYSDKLLNWVENVVCEALEKQPKRMKEQLEKDFIHVIKHGNPFLSTSPKVAAIMQYRLFYPDASLNDAKEAIDAICKKYSL